MSVCPPFEIPWLRSILTVWLGAPSSEMRGASECKCCRFVCAGVREYHDCVEKVKLRQKMSAKSAWPINQERKSSPKRKFLGRTSRGHLRVIRADIPGQNFGQSPRNPGKTSILAWTSMTRRRGRPRPQGTSPKKLRSEKLWAEFSFPKKTKAIPPRMWYPSLAEPLDCDSSFFLLGGGGGEGHNSEGFECPMTHGATGVMRQVSGVLLQTEWNNIHHRATLWKLIWEVWRGLEEFSEVATSLLGSWAYMWNTQSQRSWKLASKPLNQKSSVLWPEACGSSVIIIDFTKAIETTTAIKRRKISCNSGGDCWVSDFWLVTSWSLDFAVVTRFCKGRHFTLSRSPGCRGDFRWCFVTQLRISVQSLLELGPPLSPFLGLAWSWSCLQVLGSSPAQWLLTPLVPHPTPQSSEILALVSLLGKYSPQINPANWNAPGIYGKQLCCLLQVGSHNGCRLAIFVVGSRCDCSCCLSMMARWRSCHFWFRGRTMLAPGGLYWDTWNL